MCKVASIVLCVLAWHAYAQNGNRSEFEVVIGPSISNFWDNSYGSDQVLNTSYTWGVGFTRHLGGSFGINGRLLYERKGLKMDYTSTYYDDAGTSETLQYIQGIKFEYLSLALALRYYFDKKERLYGSLGAFAGKLKDAHNYTETYTLQGSPVSYYYADAAAAFDDFDWGLNAGVGCKLPIWWKLQLVAELGGNLGFSNIWKDESQYEDPARLFNLWMVVGAAVRF